MTEQEFQAVYERQVSRIYQICCFYLGNVADAQDAVQNIFMKLLEKQIRFRDEQHEMAWFYTVARNHCKDLLRSGWRKKRVDMEALPEISARREVPVHDPHIEQAIQTLSVKQKEVLYLYYYEEYSIREISQMLNRKESTIQTQLAAGRKKIRNYYLGTVSSLAREKRLDNERGNEA